MYCRHCNDVVYGKFQQIKNIDNQYVRPINITHTNQVGQEVCDSMSNIQKLKRAVDSAEISKNSMRSQLLNDS